MPTSLSKDLRKLLEKATANARVLAESACRAALENLAVHEKTFRSHMSDEQKKLRNSLRARGRALGDRRDDRSDIQDIRHLTELAAYEHWHRLLFTRFLTENHLLITDEASGSVPVTLEECEELAPELGARDGLDLACRFASLTLPGVFRRDDPVLDLPIALNDQVELRKLLAALPSECFRAADALGWTYQFWQAQRKEEVNKSGKKIGADELSPVTQLFTEDYMVEFLLHNTLGAWWAGKIGLIKADTEEEARTQAALPARDGVPAISWTYLRFVKVAGASSSGFGSPEQEAPATIPDWDTLAIRKGDNLPHWSCDNAIYHVSFRLSDSIPVSKRDEWLREREEILANARRQGRELSELEQKRLQYLYSEKIETCLDSGQGECCLAKPEIAHIVEHALKHFDGQRYRLHAYCVMPNHVHVIVEPANGNELEAIIHSWKSFTANEANKILKRTGQFWQHEPYDHIIRNEREYCFQLQYVWDNPDKAGVTARRWRMKAAGTSSSSAANPEQDAPATIWLPAAGTFDGWPKLARLIRLLDPCMGSGHFLVFALPLLVRLRMEEEKLSAQAAVVSVLKDNLHGLELDERCTQIAAFNVALTAWKLAGYQALPNLNLACSGLAPIATEAEWMALAGDNLRARNGMARLYSFFKDAPVLGSLINPRAQGGNLIEAEFHELAPLLEMAFAREAEDDAVHEVAVTAQGLAKAAELLAKQFSLVATNVPYLGRGKQDQVLSDYCDLHYADARADLATCMVDRCIRFCDVGGCAAVVSPQNWLFLGKDKRLRSRLLKEVSWSFVGKLGARGFQTPMFDFNVMLVGFIKCLPSSEPVFMGLDVSGELAAIEKSLALISMALDMPKQSEQLRNPDARVAFRAGAHSTQLKDYADSYQGICTGDFIRFGRCFWEMCRVGAEWKLEQTTVRGTTFIDGLFYVFLWENGEGQLKTYLNDRLGEGGHGAWIRGLEAWGSIGVCISQTGSLYASYYLGHAFDNNAAVIIAKDPKHLPAIWAYCSSPDYHRNVRELDQALKVTNITLIKVPFDLTHWQKVAAEKYPEGLPKPHSDDPTQWLFNGHPAGSTQPLHVAVARLLGYRWPRQTGSSFPDCPALGPDGLESFADKDGIICLPPVNREQPAAARLRQLVTAALGAFDERALIVAAGLKGSKSKTLEDWLRDEFFEQHAKLFHDRPFIWHLWDGRPDGFHALVNYHKLDNAALQKLTYSFLGNWIQQQSDDAKADKPGAAERLGAARALQTKLAAILEGEAPLDIFVRWKPLKDQAQGWHPDINDGIRQNIRPFLLAGDVGKRGAGLFRTVPLALKDKDRGTEPTRPKSDYPWFWCAEAPGTDPTGGKDFVGNRWNNVHLTLARKKEASS